MQEKCFWDDAPYLPGVPLVGTHETRFLIVGAGVAGLFTAYFLLKRGVAPGDILVIERGEIGSGSTGHSAGMLVSDIETSAWSKVHERYGVELASRYYSAQKNALDEIEALIKEADIACDFARREYLVVAGDAQDEKRVLTEFKAHRSLGDKTNEMLEGESFKNELNSPLYSAGERIENGISVNPLHFIRGVGAYLKDSGVVICENTTLVDCIGHTARTELATISFKHVVYAKGTAETNGDLQNYATTIVVTRPLSHKELEGMHLLDKDMFSDMERPSFHYAKITEDDRLLLGYGDEKTSVEQAHVPLDKKMVAHLQDFLDRFAGVHIPLEYGWTGVFSLSTNELPYVVLSKDATVLAGMGTQVACVAIAEYVATMLVKGEHPLGALLSV